jgi:hypothetical protein
LKGSEITWGIENVIVAARVLLEASRMSIEAMIVYCTRQ